MSDTPKTDELARKRVLVGPNAIRGLPDWPDFARELERENAKLKAALEKLAWAHYTNPLAWPDNLHELLS